MTFVINATVVKVDKMVGGHDDGNTFVRLSATAGEELTNSDPVKQAVYSNTEGAIKRVSVNLIFEGSEPPLSEGDIVQFQGHFVSQNSKF